MFRDGQTRIGVFFAREHRAYVPFDEIPKAWVTAIVAAKTNGSGTMGVSTFGGLRARWAAISTRDVWLPVDRR